MRALKTPQEFPFDRFEARFDLASMQMSTLSPFRPAVWKKGENETPGYGIRILVASSWNAYSRSRKVSWEYFYTDETGLIIESPRGLGREYNGRYRITGLDEAVDKYKDKRINHH